MRSLRWSALVGLLCVLAAVAGCGDGDEGTANRPGESVAAIAAKPQDGEGDAALPSGCAPRQVADRLVGMFRSVRSRDRQDAFRHIAAGHRLVGFTVYNGKGPGADRFESVKRAAIYGRLTELIHPDEHPRLLAAEVGAVGPLAPKGPGADGPTAGIQFSVALGRRSANGKAGIDCETGRFYVMAVDFRPGLAKQQVCGEYVHLKSRKPLICAVGASRPDAFDAADVDHDRIRAADRWHG